MESDSISLVIIVICIVMSAYFSATETAFSSLNRIRVKNMAEKGNKRAELVLRLSERYDSMLSTILIGNNIVNIASASLATILFVDMLGEDIGASVSTAVTTVVVLIFGEVSPKSIAKESPEKFAMFSAPFLSLLMKILTPFNFLFAQWKKVLSKVFKGEKDTGITEDELLTIVEEAEEDGGIDTQESELIHSALDFTDLEAREILTPRIDLTAIDATSGAEEIAKIFVETAFSRIPVYEETIDHIVGVIYQKDFYNYVYHKKKDLSAIIRPVHFITEGKKVGELLKELQQRKSHIAIVLDEFGGTVGLITLEDILEELVGEIWDEHDEVIEEIRKISDTEYLIAGSANVEKVLEMLDMERKMEVLTVSGWVMDEMERVPKKGDIFTYENLQVEVLSMDGNRVEEVRIEVVVKE